MINNTQTHQFFIKNMFTINNSTRKRNRLWARLQLLTITQAKVVISDRW